MIDLISLFAAYIQGVIEPVQSIMNIISSDFLSTTFLKGSSLLRSEFIRDI